MTDSPLRAETDAQAPFGRGPVLLLAATLTLLAGLGSPFQDIEHVTFKDALGSVLLLLAATWMFFSARQSDTRLRWHPVLVLPLMLALHAATSMAWAHTWLAGVETARWLLVTLLITLGLQLLRHGGLQAVAWGIHIGALAAAVWAALQFWLNASLFTQGPNPASSFGNRNFFAEFMVTAVPFSAYLLLQARGMGRTVFLAASTGLIIIAGIMPGTRGALVTLTALCLVVLPAGAWLLRGQLAWPGWTTAQKAVAAGVLAATVGGLGMIPTGNYTIVREVYGIAMSPLERAAWRLQLTGRVAQRVLGEGPAAAPAAPQTGTHEAAVAQASYDFSAGMRLLMWSDTLRMVGAHPVLGVGAGSWEVVNPLFQREGAQVESDYFLHNEFLQLLSEYGLVGWAFLAGLAGWLAWSAWLTWRVRASDPAAPIRFAALASVGGLLAVSAFGFPWHLAPTVAMLGVGLALLAATQPDGGPGWLSGGTVRWPGTWSLLSAGVLALALAAALVLAWRAMAAESRLVQAKTIAFTITASGDAQNPAWQPQKEEVIRLLREGTDLNPHNRRLAPMVADELARWGDWKNATWAWERVSNSRPNVVVLATNVARGYIRQGNAAKAREFLERARRVQPRSTVVRAVDVMVLQAEGKSAEALAAAVEAIRNNQWDYDMLNAAYAAAAVTGRHADAARLIQARMERWPQVQPVAAQVMLGDALLAAGDTAGAAQAFRRALELAPPPQKPAVLARVPAALRGQMSDGAAPVARKP